ncbi:MAG: LysM peptidoglycan-binding domain-containing protein, partial [Candidatus Promineifilaceae bacterium]
AQPENTVQCSRCDTINQAAQMRCTGCGSLLSANTPQPESAREPLSIDFSASQPPKPPEPTILDKLFPAMALLMAFIALWLGISLRQEQALVAAITPPPTATPTEIPTPVVTVSATQIPQPTSTTTPIPTLPPTETPTPLPTPTLEPPHEHTISDGEALFNIALRYRVSIDSIIAVNEGLSPDRIASGQIIAVPKPTATPPLTAIEIVFNGETLIADPADCVMHEIQSADTYSGIAGRFNVPLDALLLVNRLSPESILQPGDQVCVPTITIAITSIDVESGGTFATEPRIAPNPQLLSPPANGQLATEAVMLQWIADRDLVANEWYMVEVTNLTDVTIRPFRAFVQQTSLQMPEGLISAESTYRWRVSYVVVDGERKDGDFIYAFGGPFSESLFSIAP